MLGHCSLQEDDIISECGKNSCLTHYSSDETRAGKVRMNH